MREDESLYVHVRKRGEWPNRTGAERRPYCRPLAGWMPCDVTMPKWWDDEGDARYTAWYDTFAPRRGPRG